MSSSSLDIAALFGEVGRPSQLLVRLVKRVAFWAAIVLPFLHLSLLVMGPNSRSALIAFIVLVLLNVVALYIGHPYARR
ncbi:hypothetical protein BRC65_01835 [Halobacteriales archaeon QH_2_65_14]|jgi:hypothetical protein|nr:MAG: hypothetical protein BRC65_01835 [Halobacteriales archaeon QH_2_65_14]